MSEQPWNNFLSKTINIFGQFGAHFYINLKTWMASTLVAQKSNKEGCYHCGYGIGTRAVEREWGQMKVGLVSRMLK